MKLENITIGQRITLGFGFILLLLVTLTIISVTGFNILVSNAKEVIEGNKLDGVLSQKEVDHLNWVNKVNSLLTDDSIHILNVQTDDHKCGFGKWLYSDERKNAETRVPELKGLIKKIEKPHLELHQSAISIGSSYTKIDKTLGTFLLAKKVDHLLWTHAIKDAILNKKMNWPFNSIRQNVVSENGFILQKQKLLKKKILHLQSLLRILFLSIKSFTQVQNQSNRN